MKKFSADFIPEKYSNMYEHVCIMNGLIQTHCMMIAMLDEKHDQYNDYLIDQVYSKVGIREAIKKQRQTKSDPALCKAPFTSIYYKGSTNEIAFCCAQEKRVKLDNYDSIDDWWKSDYAKKFRQSFIDGKFPSDCHVCEWQEKNGIESDRPGYDDLPLVQPNIITGNDKEKPQYIDYRPDNLCNLMCTMCSPSNSNLVEKIYKQFPGVFRNQKDYSFDQTSQDKILKDKLINEDTLKLKVLGGEPTINKKVHDAFNYCVDNDYAKNIELGMTTNFTNLNATYELIEKFKQIKIQASIDATGPTYEYIRKPARWSKIKENMLEFSDRFEGNKKFRFGLNCVFQPTNAFTVKDWLPEMLTFFYDEMKIKRWGISMLAITGPTGLTFGALPQKFREVVVNDLLDVQNDFKDHSNQRLQNNISSMIKYVTDFEEYEYKKLKIFKVRTMTFDKAKKTDITTLSPLFKELLEYEE
jgi:organic radical activating enzyme